jgi:molybdopterin-guanine dinucleotide biosynthesis protein A
MADRGKTTQGPDGRVTGVVLAGGRARRMGGQDKGLVELAGHPMVVWVTRALAPQCHRMLVNANRNEQRYAALTGLPVVADVSDDFAGPLAGMYSALQQCRSPLLVSVPCDSPLVHPRLVARLVECLLAQDAELAVAHDGERMQPVFTLLRGELESSLAAFLAAGGRKIDRWFQQHRVACADFSDACEMFANINTLEERDAMQARLRRSTA